MPKPYNQFERQTFDNISEYGWQYNFVFDPKGNDPDFAYSVGFSSTLKSAEIIIFGLPQEMMSHMIWQIFDQVKAGAEVFDGAVWDGLLEGFSCITRKAMNEKLFSDYATSANWYWKEIGMVDHPEVYQLVWPGAQDGLFPWETGCSQHVIDSQPKLW